MRIKIFVSVFLCLAVMAVSAWGSTYQLADLEGNWEGNSLANGPSAPWWERASITIAADGSFTGTTIESNGQSETVAGTLSISSDGIVTLTGQPDLHCSMDSRKTVFVCTEEQSDGSSDMKVFTKKASSYSQADLAGNWEVNGVGSGPDAPWWIRGMLTVLSDGSYSATLLSSYQNSPEFQSGKLTMASNGAIANSVNASQQCSMDAGKTVLVCTSTWTDDGSGSTQLAILTRQTNSYSMADLAGVWGYHSMATAGPTETWSSSGTITITEDGSASGTSQESDESNPTTWSGSFIISSDGIVTGPAGLSCSMDSGKTLIVCTGTQNTGSSSMPIFTKLSAVPQNNSCAATLSSDLGLHIPYITYAGNAYWADLAYVTNTLDFSLTNAGLVTDTAPFTGCTPATLSSDLKLHIPVVMFNSDSYWADFQYAHDTIFTLTGAGLNPGTTTACTDYTYSDWSACQPDGTQTRTVISGIPAGCIAPPAVAPVTSQTCTYTPPPSTSSLEGVWTGYEIGGSSGWTVTVQGNQITGNSVDYGELYEGPFTVNTNATPNQIDIVVTQSDFPQYVGATILGIYQITGNTLTFAGNEPGVPVRPTTFSPGYNGTPYLTRVMVLTKESSTPQACTDYTYSAWSACQPNNTQVRTVISEIPAGCSGGAVPVLTQTCTYSGPPTGNCEQVSLGNSFVQVQNSGSTMIEVYFDSSGGWTAFGADIEAGACNLVGVEIPNNYTYQADVEITQCTPAGRGGCSALYGTTKYVPLTLQQGQTKTITVGSDFFN
jgi:uncharacterized protein (TIGR03067 family)